MTKGRNNLTVFVDEKQSGTISNDKDQAIDANFEHNDKEEDTDISPYDKSNFLSRYTFQYLRELNYELARKCRYALSDFDNQTPRDCLSKYVANRLESEWQKELNTTRRSPSLLRAVVRGYGFKLLLANLYFILGECIAEPLYFYFCVNLIHLVGQSWVISAGIVEHDQYIYSNLTTAGPINNTVKIEQNIPAIAWDDESFQWELIWNASWFMFFITLTTISAHPFTWRSNLISLEMRAALGQMIYKKALRVDKSSRKNNCDQAISLISKDLDLLEINLSQSVWIISGPLECVIVTGFLLSAVGLESALFSLLFSIVLALIRGYLNISLRHHTRAASANSDIRVSLVNETLKAIRILRMCAWTGPLYEKIKLARLKELEGRKYKMLIKAIDNAVYFLGCSGGAILTLGFAHHIMGVQINQLRVSFVFMILMIHQRTLSRYFPQGILSHIDLTIIFERIGRYLCADEIKSRGPNNNLTIFDETLNEENSIELDGVSAEWLDSDRSSLERISIAAKPGELVLIAGKVGAGKSSLLQTLLGELTITSGSVRIRGRISYASQEAWVYSGTVRDNILFGAEMNMPKYLKVLKVSCLLPDLKSFSKLDMTYVGQRGVSLSGGQKARINLARCLYHEADVYLLDDPLSAVDAHVSKQLFHDAIRGFLAKKTVILVTHQLQYMRFADKVLLITAADDDIRSRGATGEVIDHHKLTSGPAEHGDLSASSLMEMRTEEQKRVDQILLDKIESTGEQVKETKNEMEDTIELSKGSRVWRAFKFYANNCGCLAEQMLFLLLNFLLRVFFLGNLTWMNYWAGFHGFDNDSFGGTWIELMNFGEAFLVSSIMWLALTIVVTLRSTQMYLFVIKGAERIHDRLMRSLLWAKMRFFDLTPPGQVINRVSADLSYMDTTNVLLLDEIFLTLMSSMFMMGLIVVSDVRLGVSAFFVCYIMYRIFKSYINITNTVKKADGIRKGEIYTHTSLTLDGLTTIRASGKSEMFTRMYNGLQDRSSSVSFLHTSIKRLIITRLDWVMLIFYVSLIVLDVMDGIRGETMYAFVGLNLVMQLARNTQYAFTKSVELYTRLEALNRIEAYCEVAPELEGHEEPLAVACFGEGKVEFIGVSLRYEPSGDMVLRDVSFVIEPREKIGIVGRTGAGKSSLVSVLFRLYHFEGFIQIDGQDTKCLSVDSLRRSISIIPQDPELLSGSLRRNLDPLNEHSDADLWRALEAVQLKALVTSHKRLLELQVSDSGSNFSVGQRQLICLARAILRRNKLLVLDEATANVDSDTDRQIQKAIRTVFAECTVLTVAHKLSTIVDSDRIMVIDKGRLIEFDTPRKLLEREGLFAAMIKNSGLNAEQLGHSSAI